VTEEALAAATKELAAFEAIHPDFDAVSDEMLPLLKQGATLQQAYDTVKARRSSR
jgi:hypothetical protein